MLRLNAAYQSVTSTVTPVSSFTNTSTANPFDQFSRAPRSNSNPNTTTSASASTVSTANISSSKNKKNFVNSYSLQPRQYLLAVLASVGGAGIFGILWGFILDANTLGTGSLESVGGIIQQKHLALLAVYAYQHSLHLLPEILVGVGVGEVVARAVNNRRQATLQVIAGVGVFLAYVVMLATISVRILLNADVAFPPVDVITNVALSAVGQAFTGALGLLVFLVAGVALAVVRLKR
jgi:hypothetical protein